MSLGGGVKVGIGVSGPTHLLQLSADDAAKPGTNTWTIASDARLKTGITPYTSGLELLTQVQPVRFRYTGEAEMPTTKEYIGVIAQDIQRIAPYMVGTWTYMDRSGKKTDYLSYDGNAMAYILINSVKELNEKLTDQNTVLQKEIEALRQEIEALKKR
jgi:hypothetical protein